MASNNPFKDLALNRAHIQSAVEGLGATNYAYRPVGTMFQMSFELDGNQYLIAVYENKNGSTTLSKLKVPDQDSYMKVAQHIRDNCRSGDGSNFSFALPKFSAEHATLLLEFLHEEAKASHSESTEKYDLTRFQGPQGDTLTVKQYKNGTIQLQGRRATLVGSVLDFLTQVLPYEGAVQAQLDTFEVKLSVRDVSDELAGKFPSSHERLHITIRAQLASALALTKIEVQLLDYGAVAFPALRGLEGHIKAELLAANLRVQNNSSLGEYFTSSIAGRYEMRPDAAKHVGEPTSSLLSDCYTLYANERHGIAHMGSDPTITRIIGSLPEAATIVTNVLNTIEHFCHRLQQ